MTEASARRWRGRRDPPRGHQLPNPWVVHCLGPVWGIDEPADRLLADCSRNALALVDRQGLSSIAFPAISTGAFGYPIVHGV